VSALHVFLVILGVVVFALYLWILSALYREVRNFYRKPWKPRQPWREW
jgi:hypothetical protein